MPILELENQILRKTSSGPKGLTYVGGDRHTNMEHLACFSGKLNIHTYLEIILEFEYIRDKYTEIKKHSVFRISRWNVRPSGLRFGKQFGGKT